MRRFMNLDWENEILATQQCLERNIQPGPIADGIVWRMLGRRVREGEKPMFLRFERDGKEQYSPNYYVFAQTEPIREIRPRGIRGWDTETAFVNLNVRREPFTLLNGNVQGYATRNRTVAINPVARRPKSVLFHELGHIVLGHHRKDNSFHTEGSDAKRKTLRSIHELEAECISMLCGKVSGVFGAEVLLRIHPILVAEGSAGSKAKCAADLPSDRR